MLAIGIMVSLVTLKPTTSFGNETNLVGFWQFEEGEGTVVTDASGKENNGTIVEPIWVEGKIGNALQFNGNSYVEIPHNAVLNPRNALTIEAWINPANNMQRRKIISKSLGANTDYSFFQGDKNNIAFSIKMGSIARTVYAPANTLPLGEWTYVVGTYDGVRLRLYINGV